MIASAALSWPKAVFVSSDYLRYDISELRSADRRAVLVLGLFVVAGAACFIALGSRRSRMTAGAFVVLAAAAGLVIAVRAEPPSLPVFGLPCTNAPRPTCLRSVSEGNGRLLAGLGAVAAAGYGIVALLRSGGEAPPTHAAGRSPAVPSGANPSSDFATPPKQRMSDASLLAWTVVAIVIALVVGSFVVVSVVCSEPVEC